MKAGKKVVSKKISKKAQFMNLVSSYYSCSQLGHPSIPNNQGNDCKN